MASEKLSFDINVILNITSGRLLTKMDDVYEILNYITGDNLFTHQLVRAGTAGKKHLLETIPEIREPSLAIDAASNHGEMMKIADNARTRLGDEIEVTPLGSWERIDPITEACEMMA